jgi:hypothetical protein
MPRQPLRGSRGRDRTLDGGGPVGGQGHERVHHVGPIVRGEPDNNAPPQPARPPVAPPPRRQFLDEDEMLSFGLSLVGFDQTTGRTVCRELQLRRFRAFFGVGPKALACLYRDLSAQMIAAIDPQYFLMTINWLKLYDTEHVLAGRWKLREETIHHFS